MASLRPTANPGQEVSLSGVGRGPVFASAVWGLAAFMVCSMAAPMSLPTRPHTMIDAITSTSVMAFSTLLRVPEIIHELIQLFREDEAIKAECSRVNGSAPPGEDRRLVGPELHARG